MFRHPASVAHGRSAQWTWRGTERLFGQLCSVCHRAQTALGLSVNSHSAQSQTKFPLSVCVHMHTQTSVALPLQGLLQSGSTSTSKSTFLSLPVRSTAKQALKSTNFNCFFFLQIFIFFYAHRADPFPVDALTMTTKTPRQHTKPKHVAVNQEPALGKAVYLCL